MSEKTKSTAVLPSKYIVSEMEKIDPRFYIEKDFIVFVPYDIQEAPTSDHAIVMNTSAKSDILMLFHGVKPDDNIKPPKSYKTKKSSSLNLF